MPGKYRYTLEERNNAIKRADEIGIMAAARELGINDQSIRSWRDRELEEERKAQQIPCQDAEDALDKELPLFASEPPVEKIETIVPDQKETAPPPEEAIGETPMQPVQVPKKQAEASHDQGLALPDAIISIPEILAENKKLRSEVERLKAMNTMLKNGMIAMVGSEA